MPMLLRADKRRIPGGCAARPFRTWPLILPGLLFCGGCLTFSSFQTARIPEMDRPEVTAAVTRSDFREDDDRSGWSMLEFRRRSRLGRSERLEGHIKLSILHPDGGSFGGVLGGGFKAAVVRDYLAVGLPVSWYIGDAGFRFLQIHPGVIATLPIVPGLDINGDLEAYVLAAGETQPLHARHLGLAIGPADRRWAVRPEIGWLSWDDGDRRETSVQFGLAVEIHEARGAASRRTGDGKGGVF
jgi:hypothetical protein